MADITAEEPMTVDSVGLLRDQVRGRVITAADDDYDEARAVHNGMFDKRPLAVLRAEQVSDWNFPFVTVGIAHPDSAPTMAAW